VSVTKQVEAEQNVVCLGCVFMRMEYVQDGDVCCL